MEKIEIVGITGAPGSGKDTTAAVMVEHGGYVRRGFADPLYEEVAAAFGVTIGFLQNRDTKETPLQALSLQWCTDKDFVAVFKSKFDTTATDTTPLAPRAVLRCWGTEYRRVFSGNDAYWIDRMDQWIKASGAARVVIPDVRFNDNEAPYVHDTMGGVIWHMDASARGIVSDRKHASEAGVTFLEGVDLYVINDGSQTDLELKVYNNMKVYNIASAKAAILSSPKH